MVNLTKSINFGIKINDTHPVVFTIIFNIYIESLSILSSEMISRSLSHYNNFVRSWAIRSGQLDQKMCQFYQLRELLRTKLKDWGGN